MKVLLIEDEKDMANLVSISLKSLNLAVDVAEDGAEGLNLALTNYYDLIISDYNLPSLTGREIIEKIRSEGKNTPILVLSVRSEIRDRVEVLNLGADDYLSKPYNFAELEARIKALLRRPEKIKSSTLKIGDIELTPNKLLVTKNGQRITLASKEFALLQYLMENQGEILSRQEIMEHVWEDNVDAFSNTIEVHIMNLRRKVDNPKHPMIFTYSNRGYKIDTER